MRVLLVLGLVFGIVGIGLGQPGNNFTQPIATTVQLPTFGVSFDADGVLQMKTHTDPTGQLIANRLAAARAALPGNLAKPVRLRKVSVVKLQAALSERIRDGKDPSEVMRHLAGLTRITSVFCYPDQRDIVIAGPAEPWIENLGGVAVGIHSGRPTLQLIDFVVALRAYRPGAGNGGFVGCTINPQPEGLVKLQAFQQKIPKAVPDNKRARVARWVANGVNESLGMGEVQVFGVEANSHFAQVMIEADYRMKRIAIGVEQPPVQMTTFAAALTSARHGVLQRWWFTPQYDGVIATPDRMAMKMVGQGVQLQTETKDVLPGGAIRAATEKPTRAAASFANSFTRQFNDIASVSPVYAQLRQMIDYLIVAAYFRKHDFYRRADWDASDLLNEEFYSVANLNNPRTAPVAVNAFWKQRRMFAVAGGGVSIVAEKALADMTEDPTLEIDHDHGRPAAIDHWWWD